MKKIQIDYLKVGVLALWIVPSMGLLFLINFAVNKSFMAFVAVIFGCNFVYDVAKKIAYSPIKERKQWLELAKHFSLAIVLFVFSFVGIYIEIFAKILPYVGLGVIWLPCYIFSLHYFAEAEKSYKTGIGSYGSN